jgi:hypothetical protein
VQRSGLRRNLTGRGHIGERTDLFGVGRLLLKKLTLQLVDFDLAIRLIHRAREGNRERDNNHNGRLTGGRRRAPTLSRFGASRGGLTMSWARSGTSRWATSVDATRKTDNAHDATFCAIRRRADRARGLLAISPTLAS